MVRPEFGPPSTHLNESNEEPAESGLFLDSVVIEVRNNLRGLFHDRGFNLETARKIENSNFVVNFGTKGRPLNRSMSLEAQKNEARPPSAVDIVFEIFRQSRAFFVDREFEDASGRLVPAEVEVSQEAQATIKEYLDFLYLEFAGTPEKSPEVPAVQGISGAERQKHVSDFASTPALLCLDAMREALQERKGNVYDAQLHIAEQFLAFVGAKLQEPAQDEHSALPNAG